MSDRSKTSRRQTSPDPGNATSSPASEDGPTLFDSQESPTTPTSGPAPVRVSRSAKRARGAERATLDIFGQHGSHSSKSAALQRSLESRLRALTDLDGSMLYSLTWNDAVTPSGRRICALRNSLRTDGAGFSSWPTPTTAGSGNGYTYRNGNSSERCLTLTGAARMAAWPTPCAQDGPNGGPSQGIDRLPGAAPLASWATPTVSQAGGTPEQFLERKRRTRACGVALSDLGLQVRTWIPGAAAFGSTAPTESGVSSRLNPRFSLWLMGYPTAWASCGEAVTRSFRSARQPSSSPPKKRAKSKTR